MSEDILGRCVAKVIPEDLAQKKLKSGEKLRVYLGIDPTGSKLHIGHAIPLRKIQQFIDAGHEAILVIGSFTGMIGDPSDRETLRNRMTREEVKKNFKTYKRQASCVLDFKKVKICYNHTWLEKLTFKEVVDLASHFTVQQMIQRDTFRRRIQKGDDVHIHEFLYPLMVGYDSVILDVDCELGGTDQEFNLLAGRKLQKVYGKREKFVLTTPLIEGTDGRLMSKTYNNCIWLEDPPGEMYGKVMSLKDELMNRYFECFTDIPMEEIPTILKTSPRDSKARLAFEIVKLFHGENPARKAQEEFEQVFKKGGLPAGMPEVKVRKGIRVIDALVNNNIVSSTSEFQRLVKQKGVRMNGKIISSVQEKAEEGVVNIGKRRFFKIKFS